MNGLAAAWRRLQHLAGGVLESGSCPSEVQLNKEREAVVALIEGVKEGQVGAAETCGTNMRRNAGFRVWFQGLAAVVGWCGD